MRASGVRGLLIYCSDYRCSHSVAINGDRWPDDVRLSDLEPRFTCQACGRRGANVRPHFGWEQEARRAANGPPTSVANVAQPNNSNVATDFFIAPHLGIVPR
jgi:hypothetical protein